MTVVEGSGAAPGRAVVPAVARAAGVLEAVAASRDGLTLSAIARAVEAPKSSVLAICSTLVRVGYLVRTGDSYDLGVRVVRLARSYLERDDVATEFWRTEAELRLLDTETVVLAVLDGDSVVYLACRRGSSPVAVSYEVGLRLPASCTASGKAMLAAMPDYEVAQRFPTGRLARLTERSLTSLDDLRRQLDVVRAQGYAVDVEETARGMCCYGSVVRDGSGHVVAAVSVSTVRGAVDEDDVPEYVSDVRRFAARLTERLGGTPGTPAVARDGRAGASGGHSAGLARSTPR